MTVKNGDFIRIDYTESVDGQVIAATDKDVATEKGIFSEEIAYGPHLIVVGAGQLVKGFEDDLLDKEMGYSGRVELAPESAFGLHDPKQIQIVPLNRFKDKKPVPGMRVGIDNKTGTVTRIIGRKVSIDTNHPLAGRTVVYDYKIVESVEDQTERLKALIKTFARMELEAEIKDDVAVVIAPWELSYYKEWLMIRRGLAEMILQHLGLKEVHYVEKHTGERVKAELISPPAKEPVAEQPAAEQSPVEQSPAEQQ
ncbi:MAG TPA: peptidylprolyl isomerase [Methanothrix sp.]|nr:peptidylprolyl isomerase [Methanothrix sp.]HPT18815.1 peptidylprolyl isomerase [Methanothrix sp.]